MSIFDKIQFDNIYSNSKIYKLTNQKKKKVNIYNFLYIIIVILTKFRLGFQACNVISFSPTTFREAHGRKSHLLSLTLPEYIFYIVLYNHFPWNFFFFSFYLLFFFHYFYSSIMLLLCTIPLASLSILFHYNNVLSTIPH